MSRKAKTKLDQFIDMWNASGSEERKQIRTALDISDRLRPVGTINQVLEKAARTKKPAQDSHGSGRLGNVPMPQQIVNREA